MSLGKQPKRLLITIEAKKFLEEETVTEALHNAPTINDDNSEEDVVRGIYSKFSSNNYLIVLFQFVLI